MTASIAQAYVEYLAPHQQGNEATGPIKIWLPMQAVAAIAELAIPHFTTRTIFSVANLGSEANFYTNVKTLAVRVCPHTVLDVAAIEESSMPLSIQPLWSQILEIIMMANCGACDCCRCSLSAMGFLPGCGAFSSASSIHSSYRT